MSSQLHDKERIHEQVREGYAKIAVGKNSGCCGTSSGCGCGSTEIQAQSLGYTKKDLTGLPHEANLGLGCGNPTALASLKEGEVVLDLGSGGGMDVFVAGPKVGAKGKVIGVDMTSEMISRARKNISAYHEKTGLENVEFRLGEIEHLPVADNSVDVIISNCVLNLSPDKGQVWKEIARVLKPGGRVAVSDLALFKPLPKEVVEMVEALVGCVAGAALVDETRKMMQAAGLADIQLLPKTEYIQGLDTWHDPLYQKIIAHLPKGEMPSDYITSLNISARKK